MQRIDIDGIIRKVLIELNKNGDLEGKYNDLHSFPKIKDIDIKFNEIKKYIFNNFIVSGNKVNILEIKKNLVKYGIKKLKKSDDNKKGERTEFKGLGRFYEQENSFIKTIKITFIKSFINEVKFCPYCGKNSLTYFGNIDNFYDKEDDNRRTFELDHFFPKDTFYNIGFNLYNLVPSCKPCNHLKSNKNPLDKERFFHPYFGWIEKNKIVTEKSFDEKVTFNKKDLKKREYILNTGHGKLFTLKEIYNYSQDTKNDIWFIRDKIEKIKTDKINSKKLELNFDLEKRKDYFFKNYAPESEQDILKFANGKLKKDLIDNLKF